MSGNLSSNFTLGTLKQLLKQFTQRNQQTDGQTLSHKELLSQLKQTFRPYLFCLYNQVFCKSIFIQIVIIFYTTYNMFIPWVGFCSKYYYRKMRYALFTSIAERLPGTVPQPLFLLLIVCGSIIF